MHVEFRKRCRQIEKHYRMGATSNPRMDRVMVFLRFFKRWPRRVQNPPFKVESDA